MPFLLYVAGVVILALDVVGVLVLSLDPGLARALGVAFRASLATSAIASGVILALVLWAFGRLIEVLEQIAERMPAVR